MIRDAAHNVNTTVTQLLELQTQLNVSLSELREGLDNLSMSCTAGTCDLVPSPDSINLAVDWSSVRTSTVENSRYHSGLRAVKWLVLQTAKLVRVTPHKQPGRWGAAFKTSILKTIYRV